MSVDDVIRMLLLVMGGGALNVGALYVAWRNLKNTDRTTDGAILKNLQELADNAIEGHKQAVEDGVARQRAFDTNLAELRKSYDTRIAELESQIKILMEGDLRVELVIGGNPKTAKSIKIENFIALPLVAEQEKVERKK